MHEEGWNTTITKEKARVNQPTGPRPLSFRTVWISDIHLGFRGCSSDHLLDFLHSIECEYLYLVGDIIDIWEMKKRMYWPQSHNNVVRTILGKAKHGTKVVYVPGNHVRCKVRPLEHTKYCFHFELNLGTAFGSGRVGKTARRQ